MATVKLGDRPKSFKKIVKFEMLDGTEGTIEMNYKYRTRKQFGEFIDEIVATAKAAAEADKAAAKAAADAATALGASGQTADSDRAKPITKDLTMAELMERTTGSNAEYILNVAYGWNLPEVFDLKNAQQLADELPAASVAIMEAYRLACTEGRLGN